MLKRVLGVGAVVFVGLLATIIIGPKRLHGQAEAAAAVKAQAAAGKAAEKEDAPTPAIAVKNSSKKSASAKEPCQVETDTAGLLKLGQNLCKSGEFSKVEISLEDGELTVIGNLSSQGEQTFRESKAPLFKAARDFVDGMHRADPTLTFTGYQMLDANAVAIGNCWYTSGVTRCKDYSGPKPKFVH